jgi:CheY-like chemotaxis protein
MPEATQLTILLVENDEDTRRIYTDVLSQTGACLLEAGNPYEGFNALRSHSISLILTDLHMPGGGLEYLASLRRETGTCPIIVITGLGGGETIRQATLLAGATVFLEKPIRARQLREIVDRFLTARPIAV